LSLLGNREEYLHQLQDKYGERRSAEFKRESDKVLNYFTAIAEQLGTQYTFETVLAVGGTGIVHTGHHNRFDQPVVLKINRPNVEAEGTSMVEREAAVLPTLSHPNIISVLDLGERTEFSPKLTFIVEPFIAGSKPFFTPDEKHIKRTWLYDRLSNVKAVMPPIGELGESDDTGQTILLITSVLSDIATLFTQWASLLSHLHKKHAKSENGYVYLDVKPENVLVDDNLHLTSIDYGSVEALVPSDPSPVEVFFTERYAHPELIKRIKDKASSNRVRGSVKRSELRPQLDYFALGISLLEVLDQIALVRPHVVPQLPLYRSLHFLATRLLDGRNSGRIGEDHYAYASQVFPGLRESDYEKLGYSSLDDVLSDLDKELGRWSLEAKVPELATYSKNIVRVVPGFNTVLTPRLKRLIEHPLVARLKYTTQLGLVSLVYPTADHSRYDHALGSYTYTTYYVKSLFNDLGNPIFRNLVATEDVNAVLLAALLHDLGQYPLAHDLEEVHDGIFKHGQIGMDLLDDSSPDSQGRTLRQIIEDPENGWGVNVEALRRILGAHSKLLDMGQDQKASLKTNVLAAIVDGQVDSDKADYIIRDSTRCELPYGAQLDIERLLRVLTVAILPEETDPQRRIALGVYDKGLVSAHAFGQARYELLSTVYWHHTTRITKCMLQYATVWGLPPTVFGLRDANRENKELELRQTLLEFVKELVPPFRGRYEDSLRNTRRSEESLDLTAQPPEQVIDAVAEDRNQAVERQLPTSGDNWYPGIAWSDWLMLNWISHLPNASVQSQNLVRGIQSRRLYKRIATFARNGPHGDLIRTLDNLDWQERLSSCKKLHAIVVKLLKRDWEHLSTVIPMDKSEFDKLCESNLLILMDVPNPSKKGGYERPLGVVPELKERLYHQHGRQATEDADWKKIMAQMIEGSAPLRVLCHPDVRNLVSAAFAPSSANDKPAEDKIADAIRAALVQR